jgi:hypothetical protein
MRRRMLVDGVHEMLNKRLMRDSETAEPLKLVRNVV